MVFELIRKHLRLITCYFAACIGGLIYTVNYCLRFYLSNTLSDLEWLNGNFIVCFLFYSVVAWVVYKTTPLRKELSIWEFVVAVLFSVIVIINQCLIGEMDFSVPPAGAIVVLIGNICVFCCLIRFFFGRLDAIISHKTVAIPTKRNRSNFYCLFLLCLWFPYVIFTFPGNMTYDTGAAINHFMGFADNINNPYMQNYIFGGVYWIGLKLGNPNLAVAAYCVVQMLLYIVVISRIIVTLESWGLNFRCCVSLILYIGILPIFPLYALCMGKDSSFALCLLGFSYTLLRLITERNFFASRKNLFTLTILSVLLGFLRNGGQWLAVLSMAAVFAFYIRKDNRYRKILISIMAVTVSCHVVIPITLQIPERNTSESFSIPLQQTGYYYRFFSDEITDDEFSAICGVVSEKGLSSYNPRNVDPIKNTYNNNASKGAVRSYFKTWLKMFIKKPMAYLKAAYLQTYCYYTPGAISNDLKPHCSVGYVVFPSVFKNTTLTVQNRIGTEIASKVNDAFLELPIIGLFQKIGIYTWLLIAFIMYHISRERYRMILPLIPSLIVIFACCFSPINGYFRYAFPMILSTTIIGVGTIVSSQYQRNQTEESLK